MCARHLWNSRGYLREYLGRRHLRTGPLLARIAIAPDGDGDHETLEKNRDWRWRAGVAGPHCRYYGPPKRQECCHGADRKSTARGLVVGGERLRRDQA